MLGYDLRSQMDIVRRLMRRWLRPSLCEFAGAAGVFDGPYQFGSLHAVLAIFATSPDRPCLSKAFVADLLPTSEDKLLL